MEDNAMGRSKIELDKIIVTTVFLLFLPPIGLVVQWIEQRFPKP